MTIDEHAKEQEQVRSNVGPFIRRIATSASKTERGSGVVSRGRNLFENDDDSGPFAA
jgi:hypothetical protein